MLDFIVLIYNLNRNFVKCTSGGFDPDILWSLISALDHSSTLSTYFNRVKKSIMFQLLALLSSSMKSVNKSCTFATTFFNWALYHKTRTTSPGRCSRSKNFKTPFFSRYHKFLPGSNSIRSKTTPVFFVSKNLNKYSR